MRVPPFRVDAFNMHVARCVLPRIKHPPLARPKYRITRRNVRRSRHYRVKTRQNLNPINIIPHLTLSGQLLEFLQSLTIATLMFKVGGERICL